MTPNHKPVSSFASRRRALKLCAVATVCSLTGFPAAAQSTPARPLDVPYDPTPQDVVVRMLDMAKVSKDDLLYDLGSGDGRIVVSAAKKFGARGVGIDLDPERVAEARANAKEAGVEDRVTFVVGDLFDRDFSDATVVTLFLYSHVNLRLRPELWRQLKVGTRVVSYIWDMGSEWPPERTETVRGRPIYYWTITEAQKKAVAK
jgi:SAM-dependent methyltransferase